MIKLDIAKQRIINQHITRNHFEKPDHVARWFGVIQAQDYLGALWAIGLRVKNATEVDIERAIIDKTIVRTWLLRGTLHFVSAEDVRWMLELIAPRIIRGRNSYFRKLNLDDDVFARSKEALTNAFQGGKHLTRKAVYEALEKANISTAEQRGLHILWRLALEGVICFGPRKGKQQTFVLLDEWIPENEGMKPIEALAELARRYFTSHGPATLEDFIWWSGLTVADARAGLKMSESELLNEEVNGQTYWFSKFMPVLKDFSQTASLLPSFDEYLIAYKDRTAAINVMDAEKIRLSNGVYSTIVINGRVIGTWKRNFNKKKVLLKLILFRTMSEEENRPINTAAKQYGLFLNKPIALEFSKF